MVDNVNENLGHYRASFDLIHLRSVGDGVDNYRSSLEEFFLILRPGGVLLVAEWDFKIRDSSGVPIAVEHETEPVGGAFGSSTDDSIIPQGFSWVAKYMLMAKASLQVRLRVTSSVLALNLRSRRRPLLIRDWIISGRIRGGNTKDLSNWRSG